MANKMTKKDMFTALYDLIDTMDFPSVDGEDVLTRQDFLLFITNELNLLTRKSTSRKPTKTQVENETYKGYIMDVLSQNDTPMSISEIIDSIPHFQDIKISNQRVSHLLMALRKDEKVERTYVKKVAYFSAI